MIYLYALKSLRTTHDALGEDPGSADPLFPPVQQLGREGRKVALRNYFKKHSSTMGTAEFTNKTSPFVRACSFIIFSIGCQSLLVLILLA